MLIKSVIFSIYLLFLINFSLFILLIKFFYIKIITESVTLFKIISIKDFSNKTNFLTLFNNNNVFFNIKLIIIVLIIKNMKINILFLYINKKIILLILVAE